MRFWPQIISAFILFFVMLDIVEAKRITSFEKRPACEKSGGVWRQFGDACGDGCLVKFDKFVMCAQALTYSCDCLENRCFDGKRCVNMDDYEKEYRQIKEKEQELLNNLKEARSAEFENNRQRIMQKLFGPPPSQDTAQNADPVQQVQPEIPANNNLRQKTGFQPIDIVIDNPNVDKNIGFKVPPFFEKNQEMAKKSLEEKNKENEDTDANDSKKVIELPKIPLPI
ncbi:MAG: hypothetical protein ISQ34_05000 [Rickettsiales bacterium]|nr:hypothetical protein [Rickettsiales bacterium]